MAARMQSKLEVLNKIYSEREILFGSLSDRLTNEEKIRSWNSVAEKAMEVGVIRQHHDGKYVRDTTWQNWRKRSIPKRDKRNKTGEAGGRASAFDESDDLIFQIIGKDSPVLEGLDVPESSGTSSAEVIFNPEDSSVNEDTDTLEVEMAKKKRPSLREGRAQALEELNELKRQRYEEQVELCKREKRIRDLNIFKLEKELGIHPCEFTVSLHQQQGAPDSLEGNY